MVPPMAKPEEVTLPEKLLTRIQAADFLAVSPSTMARWGMLRIGPAFIKVGGRARYRASDLEEYVESRMILPVGE